MIPGDRVRVTAGDWCGETGTVVSVLTAEQFGTKPGLAIIDLDTGGQLGTTPERLEAARWSESRFVSDMEPEAHSDMRPVIAKATDRLKDIMDRNQV